MNEAMKKIRDAKKAGESQVILRPVSKVLVKFLKVMQQNEYINEFEIIEDAGEINISLNGLHNKDGLISPHFD